jgi:hypothetical protein
MRNVVQIMVVLSVVIAIAAAGYEFAFNYAVKVRSDRKMFQVRLAKLDLISYLLTSVPLFGGVVILLSRDSGFGPPVEIATGWLQFYTATFLTISALGVGAGVARRRCALMLVAEQ